MSQVGYAERARDEPDLVRACAVSAEDAVLVQAQVADVRDALLRDAAACGVDPSAVDDAIDAALAGLVGARVYTFIGVLVERSVRERLGLRRCGRPGARGQV